MEIFLAKKITIQCTVAPNPKYGVFFQKFVEHFLLIDLGLFLFKRWLFKFLKVDSINFSSRSLLTVIYLKVVGTQNH